MASQNAIAVKTANAVLVIETASTAIAAKLGIELSALPQVAAKHGPDYGRAVQLAHLADVLQKIALATGSAKANAFDGNAAIDPAMVNVPEDEATPTLAKRKRK